MESLYTPKVSIIIPVYNGSNFLAEAIDSALGQTYKNIEIIVVNDGSNDNGETEKIAKGYGDKIRYFCKENGGVSSALNLGIQQMTGEWFSWLSHDDLYLPGKIESAVEVLRNNDDIRDKLIVYSDGYLVREDGSRIMPFHRYFKAKRQYSGIEAANVVACKGTLCGCCLLIPASAFDFVGQFDENLRYSQDSLMWYQLFLNGYRVYSTGKKEVLSRVHKKQVTHTRKDLFKHDSLCVAKILAPVFANTPDSERVYYNYVFRRNKLDCNDTVEYLLGYAAEHGLLTEKQIRKIKSSKKSGNFVYKIKSALRKILVRT